MLEGSFLAHLLQQKILLPSDVGGYVDILLRWIHLVAGITWIGLLYFFNLVNVPAMKALDGPTKGKVIPVLLPKALWWFRWGAVVTVLAGFVYWVLLLHREPQPPDGTPGQYLLPTLGYWIVAVGVAWVINYFLLRVPALTKNGFFFAVPIVALAVAMLWFMAAYLTQPGVSNRVLSIAVGGGYGLFMMLNVWGIIWPNQKRIIAWTKENAEKGTAIPPEAAVLARQAFLVSRSNAWLSLPMLFFMATASHFPIFVGG
ncbi:MAG: urate hydroxylase PuuD [Candidatus Acidiferrales bacterium]